MSNSTKTALPPAKVPASVWENGVELTEEEIEAAKAELIEDDGEPLETPWHRAEINLLIDSVVWHRRGRTDFFPGGNMFVYFSRKQNKGHFYKGPDFFLVNNVDGTVERKYWWVFEEDGRFPDIIIELLSPTTADEDRTTKKKLYEKTFRTPEYFCYDPDEKKLQGWKLVNSNYQKLKPNEKGWLWSEELGLWLGVCGKAFIWEKRPFGCAFLTRTAIWWKQKPNSSVAGQRRRNNAPRPWNSAPSRKNNAPMPWEWKLPVSK